MLYSTSNFLSTLFLLFILTSVVAPIKHSNKKLGGSANGQKNIKEDVHLKIEEMVKKEENKKKSRAINSKKEEIEKNNKSNKEPKISHDSSPIKTAPKNIEIAKSECYKKCCERKLAERKERCKHYARKAIVSAVGVRVKRGDYYHDDCDNQVDGYYYCQHCDEDCDSADVHEGNSSEYSCGECGNDVRTREGFETNKFYCSHCEARKTNSQVYVWKKLHEDLEGQEDDSDDEDPCENVQSESDSYGVKCNECLSPESCANLKHYKPSYVDCEWNNSVGCEKWVKLGNNGDFYG